MNSKKHATHITGTPVRWRNSLAVSACLLAGAIRVGSATFNVLDHGAVADDKTDNTAAFAKCMHAVIAAGGGRMLLPEGVYRGRIVIPPVSKPIPSWVTVEIVGEGAPTPRFRHDRGLPATPGHDPQMPGHNGRGGHLRQPLEPTAATAGSRVFTWSSATSTCAPTTTPPSAGSTCNGPCRPRLENVFVNTGVYNVQASKPVHGTGGLITPACNNAALTILRNVVVTGYDTGILVNEHTDGENMIWPRTSMA